MCAQEELEDKLVLTITRLQKQEPVKCEDQHRLIKGAVLAYHSTFASVD